MFKNQNYRLISVSSLMLFSLFLAGCTSLKAENLEIEVASSSGFGLLENQPTLEANISLLDVSDQKVNVTLQKEEGDEWSEVETLDVSIEKTEQVEFQLAEKASGKYAYKFVIQSQDRETVYFTSSVLKIQIDDLKLLTRDLYYGEQQKCVNNTKANCINYVAANQYPGLFEMSSYKRRMNQYLMSASYPEVNTLTPDPTWTIIKKPGDPKFLLDISKPLPGETFTVTVDQRGVKSTVHVTYLNGKLHYYQW